jgi:hypothetical protein
MGRRLPRQCVATAASPGSALWLQGILILILIKVWRRAASAIAPVRRRVSGLLGTTTDRPRPRTSRGGAFFEAVRRVALAPSRGAAARPAPSKLQSRNRERPRGSSVIALARVPPAPEHIPPGTSSQRQTRMVSERPRSCTPRAQAGGTAPATRPPPSRICLQPRSRCL